MYQSSATRAEYTVIGRHMISMRSLAECNGQQGLEPAHVICGTFSNVVRSISRVCSVRYDMLRTMSFHSCCF